MLLCLQEWQQQSRSVGVEAESQEQNKSLWVIREFRYPVLLGFKAVTSLMSFPAEHVLGVTSHFLLAPVAST